MSDSTQNPPPPEEPGYVPPPPPPTAAEQPAPAQPGPGQAGPGQPFADQPMQPMAQPGYGTPSGVGQPADLLMRFLARFIDWILVGIVNAIITTVLVVGIFGLNGNGFGFSTGAGFAASAVTSVISAALYLGYFTLMESRNGQTVGKMLLKLQTQGPDGGTPTTEESLRRNAWTGLAILGIVPVIGSLVGSLAELAAMIAIAVTINGSPTRQGWHDTFAGGTKVVKIG
jgi:uncharacterized RDD family membrane protein YckC